MARVNPVVAVLAGAALALAGCGGGGGGGGTPAPVTTPPPAGVFTAPAALALSASDVQQVIAQAVAEAQARGTPAVISVTDRVGNVLAVYQMAGAPQTVTIRPGAGPQQLDLQSVQAPASLAAIAKAITGAYLSSGGNAFSTRTASEIVQETFPPQPATVGLGSGPLFGVQFSQLPCSDLEFPTLGKTIGPHPSPLGLAADPGGFPLYKNGVLVGGVGVKANTDYGFDPDVTVNNPAQVSEEAIALAGTVGFDPPAGITADMITVGGNSLIYTQATTATLKSTPAAAPAFSSLGANVGALLPVKGFFGGAILAGQAYGTEASGIRKSSTGEFNNPDTFILTDGSGNDRFAPRGGSDSPSGAAPLSAAEVTSLLQNAFQTMANARAQIRNPLNSRAQVTISVVDTNGVPLGIVRAPDAPIFGIDVSLQKARTANFFSNANAASDLTNNTDPGPGRQADIASFVPAVRNFLGVPTALTGQTAFSTRAVAGLARPLFPDGQVNGPPGPLSRPTAEWSIFASGLQTALVDTNLAMAVSFVGGANVTLPSRCTYLPDVFAGQNRLQNGLQIFAGGEPIYRNGVLVGAIGVSGDGTSQDDMIGFLGIDSAAAAVGGFGNAPVAIRADQLVINQGGGTNRVLYINCPVSPFLNSSVQNACQGK
ncbi:MAG: hypothetical protein JWO83_539 [Caulobacteraceae bacterium]|nr:hypothetical protein [Caulobacteraceae bacterium]